MPTQPFFNQWCNIADHAVGQHRLRVLTERAGARNGILQTLDASVIDNYGDTARLERWVAETGLPNAAAVLRNTLPTETRTLSRPMPNGKKGLGLFRYLRRKLGLFWIPSFYDNKSVRWQWCPISFYAHFARVG
jgi:hypothetical protein